MTTERIRLPRKLAKSVSGGALAEEGRLHPVGAVGITLNMLPLNRVTMTLAEDDLPMLMHDLVEVYNQNGSVGVYRVTKITTTHRKNRRVELAHGLDVFSDATFTMSEDFTGTVATFLQKIIDAQTQTIGGTKYWRLGTCADTNTWNKDIKYDNLMECLTEIAKTEEDYMFTFDQSTFPWTLNFVARDSAVLSEFRLSRNVENCQVTLDDADMCNRLLLSVDTTTASTDGDTTTTTHETHNDTASQAVWGVIIKTAGIKAEDVPDKAAWVSKYFARHGQPGVQITIDGWELNRLTGETLDEVHLGRICRVALPDYNKVFNERVVSVSYPDALRSPKRISVSLANKRQKAEGAFSDISSQASKAASAAKENSKNVQNNQTQNSYKFRTEKITTDGIQSILHAAGLEIDPITGVWLYASEQGANYALGSSFKVQADNITSIVNKTGINDLGSTETLYSKISQTAGEISTEVTERQNADSALSSRITQNANSISLVVSNGSISAASIVAAINNAGSSVTISADHVDLEGYVTVSKLTGQGASVYGLLAADDGHYYGALTVDGTADVGDLSVNGLGFFYHKHELSASESSGVITITEGDITSGDVSVNFNIADTQFYKDAVSAAKASGRNQIDAVLSGSATQPAQGRNMGEATGGWYYQAETSYSGTDAYDRKYSGYVYVPKYTEITVTPIGDPRYLKSERITPIGTKHTPTKRTGTLLGSPVTITPIGAQETVYPISGTALHLSYYGNTTLYLKRNNEYVAAGGAARSWYYVNSGGTTYWQSGSEKTYYKAGTPAVYYNSGSTFEYYDVATSKDLYEAGTDLARYHLLTSSSGATDTFYAKGSDKTYYKKET